jgi:hypothetical protein
MKHILTFSFSLLFGTFFSQGNLQINQVLTYGVTLCASCAQPIGPVPVGKVWKIEYKEGGGYLNVNGMLLSLAQLPCWLKSGDVVALNGNNAQTQNLFVSIVEFNIVP